MNIRTKIEEAINTIPIALTIKQERDVVDKLCAVFEKETKMNIRTKIEKAISETVKDAYYIGIADGYEEGMEGEAITEEMVEEAVDKLCTIFKEELKRVPKMTIGEYRSLINSLKEKNES